MFDLSGINWLAVVAAWVVNCAVGAYWYSPAGFAKQWKDFTDIDLMKMPQQQASKILGYVIVSGLAQAVVLAVVLNSLYPSGVLEGFVMALVLWLGFVAATSVGVTFYSGHSWGFWWLNASYFLVVILLNSFILVWW